jgi:hypothetical protein
MSKFVYQFFDVSVAISGITQGLVQNVSVKADTGLDFVSLPTEKTQSVYTKERNIQIDINYLHNGQFVNPTTCPLYNSFGNIVIGRNEGSSITFSNCLLIGTKSQIQAKDTFGSKTLSYIALAYSLAGSFVAPTTIMGNTNAERQCFTPALEDNQIGFESSCDISREFLYEPGRASPSHLCIKYPIVTKSTVTRAESSHNSSSMQTIDKTPDCPIDIEVAADAGIPNAYLESVSIEGAETNGGVQTVSYSYTSTEDYGLTRIFTLPKDA